MSAESNSKETVTNKVEYDAKANDVSAVTVYQTDRAEVKRRIKVDLHEGQNDVEIINLPSCLEESSIRVDGIGNATIFDVIYHPCPPIPFQLRNERLQDLVARQKELSSEIEIVKRQADVLLDYSKSLSGKDTTTEQLGSFLDVYAARQAQLDEKKSKLQAELATVQQQAQEKINSYNMDVTNMTSRGARVTVIVFAEKEGPAELFLTYLVSRASWTPQYDLRADVAPDSKSENSVLIHYRASIAQKTGEDWNGVELTLSTASPLLGTNIPSLKPMWLEKEYRGVPISSSRKMKRSMFALSLPTRERERDTTRYAEESDEDMGFELESSMMQLQASVGNSLALSARPPAPIIPLYNESDIAEGAVSATFTIPGLSTIPSDSDTSQQTHKVSISEITLRDVSLEWITVPKDQASAFLRCKIKNTSKYILLPGKANVFLNGNFVSKSKIPHVSPQESFSCSLGIDPAVRVTYHPQTKKTRSSGGSVLTPLTAKTTTTLYEQAISIKNTRQSRVSRLILKERIFMSLDARFKVNLLEPRALASANKAAKNALVAVAEGVKVQWALRGEEEEESTKKEELTADTAFGLMDWVIGIEPGSTIDVNFSWEVIAPAGVEWETN